MNARQAVYQLVLFIAGNEPNSLLARRNLDTICTHHLQGDWQVEVVDVFEDHRRALEYGVFATPALVANFGEATATFLGNLNRVEQIVAALPAATARI
jgi:circadian clock protein KaiB